MRVPLGKGNKPSFGWVTDIHETSEYPRIKPISAIEDERVLVTPALMELARWISRYYFCPLGTVLESVIPSAVKKRIGVGYLQIVRPARSPEELQQLLESTKARKQRAVLGRILQSPLNEGIEIHKLAEEAGTTVATVRKLAKGGVIAVTSEAEWREFGEPEPRNQKPEARINLNSDQQRVFDELKAEVVFPTNSR